MSKKIKSENQMLGMVAFFVLAVVGLVNLIVFILEYFGGSINLGTFGDIIKVLVQLAMYVVVAWTAYYYQKGKASWIQIIYWVAVVALGILIVAPMVADLF